MTTQDGRVVCRLSELIATARVMWPKPETGSRGPWWLSNAMIAEYIGLDRKTLNAWARNDSQRFTFSVLGKLCWFFGVTPASLLVYVPPGVTYIPVVGSAHIRRALPEGPVPEGPLVEVHIASRLQALVRERFPADSPEMVVARAATLLRMTTQGVRELVEPTSFATRIDRTTLTRLCALLQVTSLDELFTVPPLPSTEAR